LSSFEVEGSFDVVSELSCIVIDARTYCVSRCLAFWHESDENVAPPFVIREDVRIVVEKTGYSGFGRVAGPVSGSSRATAAHVLPMNTAGGT